MMEKPWQDVDAIHRHPVLHCTPRMHTLALMTFTIVLAHIELGSFLTSSQGRAF